MITDTDPIDHTNDRALKNDDRKTDVPVISIERTTDEAAPSRQTVIVDDRRTHLRRRGWLLAVGVLAVIAVVAAVWYVMSSRSVLDMPVSVSDNENIMRLAEPVSPVAKAPVMVSDSVFGVAFDMYRLDGLAASLENRMPDPEDSTLMFFCRSADYRNPGYSSVAPVIMGSMVAGGRTVSLDPRETRNRPGYMAISPAGRPVIGVSLSDRVMEHVAETGGSFFRQGVLLSAGTLPREFNLHGKVERAAIGRLADGSLHYILTRHRETMYDFADALREYGFVDALYITGGNAYDYHRDAEGRPVVSDALRAKYEKYATDTLAAPLLVFRTPD